MGGRSGKKLKSEEQFIKTSTYNTALTTDVLKNMSVKFEVELER